MPIRKANIKSNSRLYCRNYNKNKIRTTFSEEYLVHLVAVLTAAMGVINVLSAVTPSMRDRLWLLERYSPFSVSTGGHLTSALAGFALLLLSVSLWRRKQLGWILTFAILLLSIPTHLLKGLDYEEATLAALLAGLLFYLRPYFHARSDTPSIKQGLQILFAAFVFTIVYGVLGFYLLDRHFKISFGLWTAIRQMIFPPRSLPSNCSVRRMTGFPLFIKCCQIIWMRIKSRVLTS